ncbi:MAG: hypothetical protein WEC37_02735 [Anaerolineales bacterium]
MTTWLSMTEAAKQFGPPERAFPAPPHSAATRAGQGRRYRRHAGKIRHASPQRPRQSLLAQSPHNAGGQRHSARLAG